MKWPNKRFRSQITHFSFRRLTPCSLLVPGTPNLFIIMATYILIFALISFLSLPLPLLLIRPFISMSNDTGHCIVHRSGRINGIRNDSEHKKHAHIEQWPQCIYQVRLAVSDNHHSELTEWHDFFRLFDFDRLFFFLAVRPYSRLFFASIRTHFRYHHHLFPAPTENVHFWRPERKV